VTQPVKSPSLSSGADLTTLKPTRCSAPRLTVTRRLPALHAQVADLLDELGNAS
jgi:hypothetical protein